MGYPLIILGAGASKGCIDLDKVSHNDLQKLVGYTPPITNQLFDRTKWESYIKRWDEIQNLATDAIYGIKRYSNNLELFLTHLHTEVSKENPERLKQLLALRFYLATLFTDISNNYNHPSNHYRVLLQQMRDSCQGKGIFVNFNYDLLLERNIPAINAAKNINDFVAGDIKVFKVHGSCNWTHEPMTGERFHVDQSEINSYIHYVAQAEKFSDSSIPKLSMIIETDIHDFTRKESYRQSTTKYYYYLPALAIPLAEKPNAYICPTEHIESLKIEIDNVDRILVIGWRAQDNYLVELLNQAKFPKYQHKIRCCIVSGNAASADEISKNFKNNKLELITFQGDGFGDFLGSGDYTNFWKKYTS